jgi:beta-phosphoglucomutase-like phosphatase (HAD superfamily)
LSIVRTSSLGAIFDWDGVVINSADLHRKSWEILSAELELPLIQNHFVKGFGK